MNTQLFIPKKIKVGYQKRDDTYTKKLAYVIYFDNKGKLRKEASWEGWRDKKQGSDEFENVPTEGFVLNKGVGGARESYGWNTRNEYIRVYDPRNFEFEISVKNLLFILSETNSFKGKGLEGTFVYSWDGKDLVLIPTSCSDYKASANYTTLQDGKVSVKELIPGAVYQTKKEEKLIYLGKFPWYEFTHVDYREREKNKKNALLQYQTVPPKSKHIFQRVTIKKSEYGREYNDPLYLPQASLSNIASCISDTVVDNYAELMDKFSKFKFASKPVSLRSIPSNDIKMGTKFQHGYENYEIKGSFFKKLGENEYAQFHVDADRDYDHKSQKYVLHGYQILKTSKIKVENGLLSKYEYKDPQQNDSSSIYDLLGRTTKSKPKRYTEDEVKAFGFEKLLVVLENTEIPFNKFYGYDY